MTVRVVLTGCMAIAMISATTGCKRKSEHASPKPAPATSAAQPSSPVPQPVSQHASTDSAPAMPSTSAVNPTTNTRGSVYLDALRRAVAKDPGLDDRETIAALAAALDAIHAEFSKQPRGEIRFEPMASQLADVYECLGAPLWFELRVTDEQSRLALTEAYFHFQGSASFERAKLMDRQSPEFQKRYVAYQPEAMTQNLRLWLDILIGRAGDYSKWSADLETAAKPLGLPTGTRSESLRTALELLKQRKLPRDL